MNRRFPEIRVSGPVGGRGRTVTINGQEIPAVKSISVRDEVNHLQKVTLEIITDNALVAAPSDPDDKANKLQEWAEGK